MFTHNPIFSQKTFEHENIDLKKYFDKLENIEKRVEILTNWYKDLKSGKVGQRTEKQQQSEFLDAVFGSVLGYEKNELVWHLEKEFTLESGTVPDGVLGIFGVQRKAEIKAVIELKKLQINLDKEQRQRDDRKSPVQQAFSYAQIAKCQWIIVSNFDEIRLYHCTDPNRYESFLFSELLTVFANEKEISRKYPNLPKFFYVLSYGQLFNKIDQNENDLGSVAKTEKLYFNRFKRLSEITNKFYKNYKQNRQILHQHLQERNPNLAIDYFFFAQKILDRLIFIRFAEEIEIVDTKLIRDFWQLLYNLPTNKPLAWQNALYLFSSFDEGFAQKIPPFNGELFKPLPILYELVVENDIFLAILRFLNLYDFRNDLKVDILGHIFEQSLNDLQSEIENATARRKDGVFYTPEYITDYMINQTLLKLLTEKKEEIYKSLEIDFISEFETDLLRWQSQNETNRKKAAQIYTDFFIAYENVLKNIKILDPACGSGAFLTRVFDILFKEMEIVYLEKQKAVDLFYENFVLVETPQKSTKKSKNNLNITPNAFEDSQSKTQKMQRAMAEIGRNILLENLFGVDLNKESTEITKLSLWLKTANRFVSLANLSENIKQGNSLIHDLSITDRAFDWQKSFPKVMESGGFDLILGNPPYFSMSTLPENVQIFYQKNYKNADKSSDIYCVFFEKALNLLKNNGILMFITSNQWLQSNYGRTLRNFVVENGNPELLVNFGGFKVFADATVDTSILLLRKTPCKHHLKACHVKNDFAKTQNLENYINQNAIFLNDLKTDRWIIADDSVLKLREKIRNTGKKLKNWEIKINYGIKTGLNQAFIVDTETKEKLCEQIKINRGLLTGLNEAFIVDHSLKEKLCSENSQNSELFVPILRGRDVHQYQANWANLWLILTKNGVDIEKYPAIKKHLESFENIKKRSDQGENWWNLRACAYYEDFEKPKIIYPETTVRRSEFYLDLEKHYIDKTCFMITANKIEDLYYLLGILTSGLIEWYLEEELRSLGKTTVQYSKQYVENIPIPVIENEKQSAIYWQIVELMQNLKTADIYATKSILNDLVAELFGLNAKEKVIAINIKVP